MKTASEKNQQPCTIADVMPRFFPYNQEPYPDNSPVLLLWDNDMGWIVEAVNNGEYEVENLPMPDDKNEEPDWELAYQVAKERGVRIKYFHRWGNGA